MSDVLFGTIADVGLRDAWQHEASNFTPWLAQNLDRLSDVIGLPLEAIAAEAGLPTKDDAFSADILARNLMDNSNVLIENQLEGSDHTHLGQILTYLAGLEAKTTIWVAKSFRESHLAAIKWLNENTREEFSFFAVKVRVVRIGNSPYAPLFAVLEKPNTWERRLQSRTREKSEISDLGLKRKTFWKYFQNAFPRYTVDGIAGGAATMWRKCADGELIVSYYLSRKAVGLFVRSPRSHSTDEVSELLSPHKEELEKRLGVPLGPNSTGGFLANTFPCDFTDTEHFEAIAAWLNETLQDYEAALASSSDHRMA